MTQALIILINIIALSLGGHFIKGLFAVYKKRGIRVSLLSAALTGGLLYSGTTMANSFILQIAEATASAP